MSAAIEQALSLDDRLLSELMDKVRAPRAPYISPLRFSEMTGIGVTSLARYAGVHRNTVSRRPQSEKLQARLQDMLKAIAAASEATQDLSKAIYWFCNEPIADYRYKTPIELVSEGHLDAVLAYIEDVKNGTYG